MIFKALFIIFAVWTCIMAVVLVLSVLFYRIARDKYMRDKKINQDIVSENDIAVVYTYKKWCLLLRQIYLIGAHKWLYRSRLIKKKDIGKFLFLDWNNYIHLYVPEDRVEEFRNLPKENRMDVLLQDICSELQYLKKCKVIKFSTFTMLLSKSYAKEIATDNSFKCTKSSDMSDYEKLAYVTNLLLLRTRRELLEKKRLFSIIDQLELVSGVIDFDKIDKLLFVGRL